MSNLSGGGASKAGGNHEGLWGVRCMLKVYLGDADSIRIEPPGVDKAEFYLSTNSGREYWQAKRQVLNQANWSLQRLKAEGVLGFFQEKIRGGDRCVFASMSDAPELRVLAENARDAVGYEEFTKEFLVNKDLRESFADLKSALAVPDGTEVFKFLTQVEVESAHESTLGSLLIAALSAHFSGPGLATLSILRDYYNASIHKILSRDDILAHLTKCAVKPREALNAPDLSAKLEGVTQSYLAVLRTKLIRGLALPRTEATAAVDQIRAATTSCDIVLLGPAGTGKSGVCFQIVEGLRSAGIPVLAFRLDRVKPVATTIALGEELGLPESPVIALAQVHPARTVVLLIDQLDYVSASSGRNSDFFDTVAALCQEVGGLRTNRTVHLILVCRKFDYDTDTRLRQLASQLQKPIEINGWTEAEVKSTLASAGGKPAALSAAQIRLLQLPQNLALLLDTGSPDLTAFSTQKDLFDAYWDAKRKAVGLRRPGEDQYWLPAMETMAFQMNESQELSVPQTSLDAVAPAYLEAMLSEGVFTLHQG
ncbi:MAG: hypothetical protein ABI273_20750, partial [Lacunisphaera sp.]